MYEVQGTLTCPPPPHPTPKTCVLRARFSVRRQKQQHNNTTHNKTKTAARQDQTKQAEQSTKRSWGLHACPLDSTSEGHSPGTKVFHPDKCLEITDICSHIDSDVRSSFPPWPVHERNLRHLRHLRHLRSDWIPLYACYLALRRKFSGLIAR